MIVYYNNAGPIKEIPHDQVRPGQYYSFLVLPIILGRGTIICMGEMELAAGICHIQPTLIPLQ